MSTSYPAPDNPEAGLHAYPVGLSHQTSPLHQTEQSFPRPLSNSIEQTAREEYPHPDLCPFANLKKMDKTEFHLFYAHNMMGNFS